MSTTPELTGDSPAVRAAAAAVRAAAASADPALIVGERGFSAERVAREIHGDSSGAFVTVDCGAAAEAVIRTLFGHVPGRRADLESVERGSALDQSRGGTLLLLNVGELPAAAQLRLSRAMRDGEVRIGAAVVPLDARVIGAAFPGIERDVVEHRFRPELLERLQRVRVDIPALRERTGDMPAIIQAVLREVCASRGTPRSLAPAAVTALAALPWTGNIDELRSSLDRLVATVPSGMIRQEDVLADLRPGPPARRFAPLGSLREARLSFEREYIAAVLQAHGWRMSDAARTLGIQRANLYRKTRQLGIVRAKPSRVS